MAALNDGSLAPASPAAARRPKASDHHTLQSIVLTAIFVFGIVGVVATLMQGQNTAAFLIGLFSSAIILGTVC
ncbi:hypothetical protein [Mycobacterium sp. GA-2829]|uniref:hypothetical protein n=1 Tax=Mycobacterium sp. GA-2829 TaxID=1772283 RepID=UPI00073FF2A2|nr:hypothetical protein [Mycobacterium sp. GA-2829]KUI39221.1 hypothetical protein AU194_14410 [Mycobacterium sp. GA-2829]